MELINIIGFILWSIVAFKSIVLFFRLNGEHYLKIKVIVVTILLLAGLNICRSFISIHLDTAQIPRLMLLSNFYIGTSVFQLLLSYCALDTASDIIKNNKKA